MPVLRKFSNIAQYWHAALLLISIATLLLLAMFRLGGVER